MVEKLREMGLTPNTMYALGVTSIGMSFVSWMMSLRKSSPTRGRWGLFLGEWAPTFIALGLAMRLDEKRKK